MLSTSDIKYLKSLHNKKYRTKERKVLLEGFRLISQSIIYNTTLDKVWMTEGFSNSARGKKLICIFKKKKILLDIESEKNIYRISDSQHSQGIVAITAMPDYINIQQIPQKAIYLDNISDPGNMGTLLRTAAWFGIDSIFLSTNCVDIFNSKTIRSAMGAHFYFKQLSTVSPNTILSKYRKSNISVLAGDIGGDPLDTLDIKNNKWIFILGSEANGISSSIYPYITKRITIPGKDNMESLNVAVAAGIILHHLTC